MANASDSLLDRLPTTDEVRRRLEANVAERAALRKLMALARKAQEAREKQEAAR